MAYVNIVTSDRGWILERLAREIASRLPYVRFTGKIDPQAGIQYYMTYSCRAGRVSPVEVAYFAHLETDEEARRKFFSVARDVDYCVTHAHLYARMLRDFGIDRVEAVPPGVDLAQFGVKLRVGVVGRTYHTGRKGEHFVDQLRDIPEIDWKFTGDGWPGPGLHVAEADLAEFYRNLDYVLVPSLYEGGPMCVVEALACGTEVIAPPVGWVTDYPHTEFPVGDIGELRRILLDKIKDKKALRASVLDRSWASWATGHDAIFQRLAAIHGLTLLAPPEPAAMEPDRVGLFLHGSEDKSPGGPSVRVPRLARELSHLGFQAGLKRFPGADLSQYDVVHAFNVWAPDSALDLIRRAKLARRPVVFSPIFLNLAQRPLWQDELPRIFENAASPAALAAGLDTFQYQFEQARQDVQMGAEPVPGFHGAVREMLALSDHVIYLSERERERLERIGARPRAGKVVHNPVDHALFAGADPALFEAEFGLKDFILCVARQETRKNQLMLLHALRGLNIPIVLVGHVASPSYRGLLERYASPNVTFIDRLAPNSALLASAFAAARVAVLPSWAEGAPLAALEAAAAGASMVLSNESGEEEYFGGFARYADPASATSLRHAIVEAYETRRSPEAVAAQQSFVARHFGWNDHVAATRAIYRATHRAAMAPGSAPPPQPAFQEPAELQRISIVFDVTTSANHKGRWTGIARVEAALALALKAHPNVSSIEFVAWNHQARSFVAIPFHAIASGNTSALLSFYESAAHRPMNLPRGAHYIVAGSAWMQNASYAEALVAFKNRHELRLTPVIHDVIPVRFPFWFKDGYAPVFTQNLALLLGNADYILAISQCTKQDIIHFAAITRNLYMPEIGVFREGDGIGTLGPRTASSAVKPHLPDTPFILCVGAIHQRKNHKLLYDVWLKLAERMGGRCPKLAMIGGVAWNGEELARALKQDARIAEHVVILEHIDDDGLSWLYANCMFTVYPSLYEGWGLPVAESLRYGKLCIAANAASVPEIAPGFVELLDPLDPVAWLTKIHFFATSRLALERREQQIREGYQPFGWTQSATELIARLAGAQGTAPVPRPYTPGSIVLLSSPAESAPYKVKGWHLAEHLGSWSSELRAVLAFELREPLEAPAVLVAQVQALVVQDAATETHLFINGIPAGRWMIGGGGPHIRAVLIPPLPDEGKLRLRVEFQNVHLIPAALLGNTKDKRSMGIGVGRIALVPSMSLRNAQTYFDPAHGDPHQVHIGQDYNFNQQASIRKFLKGNWSYHPAWGMFNVDQRPQLSFLLHEALADDLCIEFVLRAVANAHDPMTVMAMVNDVHCASWTFLDDQVHRMRLPVDLAIRHRCDPLQIDLVASGQHAPKAFGLGDLDTEFGFALLAMRVNIRGQPRMPRLPPVPMGQELIFSTTSEESPCVELRGAWHPMEKDGVWANGSHACLALRLPRGLSGNLAVWLEASVLEREGKPVPVQVRINGLPSAEIMLTAGTRSRVPVIVPESAIRAQDWLELEFTTPPATSPYRLGRGDDERLLGLRLHGLAVEKIPLLPFGTVAYFGVFPAETGSMIDAAVYARGDWFPAERDGRWTHGPDGKISFVSPGGNAGRLFLLARPVGATMQRVVAVDIRLAGEPIDRWFFHGDSMHLIEVHNFAEASAGHFETLLELQVHNAQRPKTLGIADDGRLLGLFVRAMVLLEGTQDESAAAALFTSKGLEFESSLNRTHEMPELHGTMQSSSTVPARSEVAWTGLAPQVSRHCQLVEIEKMNPAEFLGQPKLLVMSAGGNALELLAAGWYGAEMDGTWSEAAGGFLRLPATGPDCREIKLILLIRVYGTAFTGPAPVVLTADGTLLIRFYLEEDVTHRVKLVLDLAVFGGAEPVLGLQRERAISPAEAGERDDTRMLGVLLHAMIIEA